MFVAIAKVTLAIPDSGSLKSKRHVVHKVLDKVKARFNVSIAEVDDNDLWQKATLGIAVVANEHAFAQECLSKVVRYVEELYAAPVVAVATEVIPLGGELYGEASFAPLDASAQRAPRTLAEAEAAAALEDSGRGEPERHRSGRHGHRPAPRPKRELTEEDREQAIEELKRRLRQGRGTRGTRGTGGDLEGEP